MRLHHLGITAFGPFAADSEVDLEELSASGLFLIQGPTGAGKTSVLDAICFALYAALPGARSGARSSLRSDHAAEGAVPQVRLEFTAGGRRFLIVRSPEFQRPKKRGTGTTKVQASVVLEERVDGEWVNRGTRNDEVAQVIQDVVGMGLEQFVKVVLLPQGDFAAFLRASPEDRRTVLAKLFDTSRFTDIEAWLADRRRELAADLADNRAELGRHLAQVDTAVELLDLDDPTAGPTSDARSTGDSDQLVVALPDWGSLPRPAVAAALTELESAVTQHAGAALASRSLAEDRHEAADAAWHAGRRTLELQEVAARAAAELEALDEARPAYDAATATVAAARRAAVVSGHLEAADDATAVLATTSREVRDLAAPLAGLLGWEPEGEELPDGPAVDGLAERLRTASGPLDRARTTAEGLAPLRREADAHETDALARDEAAAGVASQVVEAGDAVARAEEALAGLRRLAGTVDASQTQVDRLTRTHRLSAEQDRSRPRLAALEAELAQARAATLQAREESVSLRERRLEGMAGELAASLADGQQCPVCGACEHPSPATRGDVVTSEQVALAEQAVTDAGATEAHRAGEVAALAAAVASRDEELAGVDATTDELADELARARQTLDQALAAATGLATAEAQVEARRRDLEGLRTQQGELTAQREAARALASAARERLGEVTARVRDLQAEHDGDCPCVTFTAGADHRDDGSHDGSDATGEVALEERLAAHEALVSGVEALARAVRAHTAAAATAGAATARLEESLRDNEFTDVGAVREASLPESHVRELESQLRELDRRRDQAEARLADPEVVAARDAAVPDLDQLTHARDAAGRALGAARDRHTLAERASSQLRQLHTAVRAVLDRLGPAEDEAALVQELADCVAGTSANNALRMRLSSYVLAARLEEVTLLANERLRTMSDGRYALEYTDALAARGARSGLGLRVRDAWTGLPRDTSTLSGGEAFMASLALALGLGDAVKAEAGGLDLQTLFVDEGFGTLDEESLEQVMSVLDGLREGGRAVGIVSHVAELRQRIPVQLRVTKTQRGSELTVRVEDAPAA
ncbi:SMC family ATPase [Oryzihumus sp.]|uniref:SMC family ATPase n=1 Tax=Oryzihumus sp. TaxID=1968903 RepID=UPI002ED7A557